MFALLLLGVTQGFAAKVEKTVNLTVNGKSRSYLLYVPANVQENAPLVFSLHGTGGHSSDKAPMGSDVSDANGFIVVYPQGSNIYFPVFGGTLPGWQSTGDEKSMEDVAFFKAIIEDVAKTYTIDRKRIYCCGFSNGGMMTYSQTNTCADVFAAFASISGFQLNEFHLHHTGARPVPFLHIHGKNDNFVDIARMPTIVDEMVARLGANPVPVVTKEAGKYTKSVYEATEGGFPYIYYVIDGMGHEAYTNKTPEGHSGKTIWNFMKQYTLDSPRDETLKWRPNVETEGYVPSEHGWIITGKSMLFGDDPNNTSKNIQNVYHSFQLVKGNYKLCFKSQGAEGTITVTIKKYTGNKAEVLNRTVKVGEDATIVFAYNDDDFAECRFRLSSTVNVSITDLALYSATDEELSSVQAPNAFQDQPATYYTLAGVPVPQLQKGLNIVRTGSEAKTIYVK